MKKTFLARFVILLYLLGAISSAGLEQSQAETPTSPSSIEVHAGNDFTCALNNLGAIRCWGYQDMTPPESLGKAKFLATGVDIACAINEFDKLLCWQSAKRLTYVPSDLGSVKNVSVGSSTVCAVTQSDFLRCWNLEGIELLSSQEKSRQVSVASGSMSFCSLNFNSKIDCWSTDQANYNPLPGVDRQVTKLRVNQYGGCALDANLTLRCWGTSPIFRGASVLSNVNDFELGIANTICYKQANSELECDSGGQVVDVRTAFHTPSADSLGQIGIGGSQICRVSSDQLIACLTTDFSKKLEVPYPEVRIFRLETFDQALVVDWRKDEFFPAITVQLNIQNAASGTSPVLSCSASGQMCRFNGLVNGANYRIWASDGKEKTWSRAGLTWSRVIAGFPVIPKWLTINSPTVLDGGFLQLTADIGTWDPIPDVEYKWFKNGVEIGNSDQKNLGIGVADLTASYRVEIRTRNPFFEEVVKTSTEIKPKALKVPCLANLDTSIWMGTAQQPNVLGKIQVGEKLEGTSGKWPKGTNLCSFWFSDGGALTAKNVATYVPAPNMSGKKIQYVVVGTSPSGVASGRYSNPVVIQKRIFTMAKAPAIEGKTLAGNDLTIKAPAWDKNAKYTYQWFRNDVLIPVAKNLNYRLSENDLGQKIAIQVCASEAGFETMCTKSSKIVPLGILKPLKVPTLRTTSSTVGSQITLSQGTWPTGTQLTVVWKRDGVQIEGQNGATYVIANEDRGHTLSVSLKSSKKYYSDLVTNLVAGKIP